MSKKLFIALVLVIITTILAGAAATNIAKVIWRGEQSRPRVALTFDDGPKPEFCLPILDTLDQYGVKATFFVVGRDVRWHPDLILRMAQSGHEIANHTYSHQRMDSLSPEQMDAELSATNEMIAAVIGEKPLYFRPPGGRFNRMVLEQVHGAGLVVVNWSVNAGDYVKASKYFRPSLNADDIVANVVSKTSSGDIILLHNGGGPTAEALPQIIEKLRAGGFELVTISQLLGNDQPRVYTDYLDDE